MSKRNRMIALALLHTLGVGCSASPRALAREDAERFAQRAAQDRYDVDMVLSSPARESGRWRFIGHVRGLEDEQGGHYFVQVDDTANVNIIPGR